MIKGSVRYLLLVGLMLVSVQIAPSSVVAQQDIDGAQDHPQIGRFEGSVITRYTERNFDIFYFPKQAIERADEDAVDVHSDTAEGRLVRIRYDGPDDVSALEVLRNYQAKFEDDGFEIVFSCRLEECGAPASFWTNANQDGGMPTEWQTQHYIYARLTTDSADLSASVFLVESGGGDRPLKTSILASIVEAEAVRTDQITLVEADELAQALATDGRIAIYGIFFDFDSADLQPASQPQIAQLGTLMGDNPNLRVLVVGHTDGQGGFDYNLSLSQRRAQSVVDAIISEFGIAAERMTPAGAGMVAPVATNRTEEGRARNRRVEIVELVD
ncbi:MAG: OmpA family protein [Pseudomonadota bacterium]